MAVGNIILHLELAPSLALDVTFWMIIMGWERKVVWLESNPIVKKITDDKKIVEEIILVYSCLSTMRQHGCY